MICKVFGAAMLTLIAYSETMRAADKHTQRLIYAATAAGGLDNAAKHKTFAAKTRSRAIFAGAAVLGMTITAIIVGEE